MCRHPNCKMTATRWRRGRADLVFFADGPNALEHHDPIFDRLIPVDAGDPRLIRPAFGFSTPKPNFDFKVGSFADAFRGAADLARIRPLRAVPDLHQCLSVRALIAAGHPELVSHLVLMQALDWDQARIWTGKIVDPNGDLQNPMPGRS